MRGQDQRPDRQQQRLDPKNYRLCEPSCVDGVEREPADGTDVGVLPCRSEAPSAWDVMARNIAGNRGVELM